MPKPYECWVWVVMEPDGKEGAVAAYVAGMPGPGPLMTRTREHAEMLKPYARVHAERSGNPVRLIHLKEVEDG